MFFQCFAQNTYSKIIKSIYFESLYYTDYFGMDFVQILLWNLESIFSVDVKLAVSFAENLLLCGLKNSYIT